jgi:Helix-turn-helix domain
MLPKSEPRLTWVTEELRRAVKGSRHKQYRLAADCRMNPSLLSRVLNGRRQIPVGDWRITRLARRLGLPPSRAFEDGPRLWLCPSPSAADRANAPRPAPQDPDGDTAGASAEGPPET